MNPVSSIPQIEVPAAQSSQPEKSQYASSVNSSFWGGDSQQQGGASQDVGSFPRSSAGNTSSSEFPLTLSMQKAMGSLVDGDAVQQMDIGTADSSLPTVSHDSKDPSNVLGKRAHSSSLDSTNHPPRKQVRNDGTRDSDGSVDREDESPDEEEDSENGHQGSEIGCQATQPDERIRNPDSDEHSEVGDSEKGATSDVDTVAGELHQTNI